MPLVFVHGVNVRDDAAYREEVLIRDQLMLNIFFPLAGLSSGEERLIDAFWGDLAPAHRPGNLFLPEMVPLSQRLRQMVAGATVVSDAIKEACVDEDDEEPSTSTLLSMVKSGSLRDLLDLLVASANEEHRNDQSDNHYQLIGRMALRAVKVSDKFKTKEAREVLLKGVSNDDQLLQRLADELHDDLAADSGHVPLKLSIEVLRQSRQWLHNRLQSARGRLITPATKARLLARAKIDSVKQHTRSTTSRLAARTFMHPARQFVHGRMANFVGDSFFYFGNRGTVEKPGPVPARVIGAIQEAQKLRSLVDPYMIIVAHSMGGIAMCDIVSYFSPDMPVDLLVTVGSQFPLFADLQMFPGLDQSNLPIVRPPNVKHWINIFDPNDFLGFAAGQVFEGIEDVEYASGRVGVTTHVDYFKKPSFYQCMANAVKSKFARQEL